MQDEAQLSSEDKCNDVADGRVERRQQQSVKDHDVEQGTDHTDHSIDDCA